MKGSRLYKVLSIMLSFMLVFSLFPTQALATVGEGEGGDTVVAPTYYYVTFQDYDGTFISSESVLEGQAATAPTHPERNGYVADGWDTDFSAVTSDLTVTAVYKAVELHIWIYIGNNNSNLLQHYVMSPLTSEKITAYSAVTNRALVNLLQTDTGFALAGKSTFITNSQMTGNGTVQLLSSSDPTVYNVYIHLKDSIDVDYTVRYVNESGDEIHSPYENDGHVGQTVTKSAISISGYTLISDSPQSITLDFGSNVITFVYSRTYYITYYLIGGTNNPANPSSYTKVTPTFTLQNPTKLGYTFTGWTPSDVTIEQGTTGNLAFTAGWELTNYIISYELNGGVNSPSNPSTYNYNSATITLQNPTRAGYNFLNWSPSNKILRHSTGDKTFTASWSAPLIYSISYVMNGGTNNPSNPTSYTVSDTPITLGTPTRPNYTFNGWSDSGVIPSGGTGNKTFTASWTPTAFNITYNLGGGTNNAANPTTYNITSPTINLQDPSRAGYVFTGWSPSSSIPSGSTGDKEFTAGWQLITYNITYELNGGVNASGNPSKYTVETPTFTLGDPTKEGYNFVRWEPADATIEQGTTGDLHFVAVWSDAIEYTITYNLDGGDNHPSNPASYDFLTPTFSLEAPTKTGYTFAGWDPLDTTIEQGSTGDLTFTASWTLDTYTITYNLDGGTNNPANPSSYDVTTPTFTLGDPTKEFYTFTGWMPVDATIEQGSTGDLEFTASWERIPEVHSFGLTFMQIAGSDETDLRTYRVSHNDTSDLYYPVKLGYKIYGTSSIVEIPTSFGFNHTTANRFSDPFYFTTNALGVDQSETCILYWWNAAAGSWIQASTKASTALHKVTYDANGGTLNDPSLAVQYVFHANPITEPIASRTGYMFDTWSYSTSVNLNSVTVSSAATASWMPDIYTITYNLDGGINHPDNPLSYDVTTPTFTLGIPTKAGYTFTGWSPEDITIEQGSTGNLEFTAGWSMDTYTITYNLNGGMNHPDNPSSYDVTTPTISLSAPTKLGYTFNGWTPTDNIPTGSTGDKAFTATWSNAIVYDIKYELNGGVNNGSNPSIYTVESGLITLANPTKAGYNFLGWTPTDNIPAGSTGDKTFTATWSAPIAYNITYVLGGGTNDPSNPATYNVTSATITLAAPTRLGYNFLGWSPTDTIATGSTGDKTFTARWSTAIRYNITYTMNGGNNSIFNPSRYTVNSATITLRDPWRIGYDFAGWTPTDNIPTGSTGDKAFTANWTPSAYTIHYYLNGGINDAANPATYTIETPIINLANPTRAGYEFWFWFPLNSIPQGSVGDRYVWAIWKAPTNYSINYVLNGGTNNPANPSIYNVESSTINLADPTRTGYTFAGWSPTNSIPAGSTGDKEFTASWTPITYNITYDLAGGVNDAGNPATYTIETPTFSLADPTRDFYTFAGWTPADTTIEQGSTGDLSFTASWMPISYNITYVLNGGTNDAANPATYTVETPTFTLAAPTQLGYTFTGWDPADATIELGSHGDLTFTATWTPIVYPITYVMNGGANPAANPATYTIESPTITLAAPAQAGYVFLGWTPAGVIPTGTTGALTFTANWSAPIVYDITYVMNGGINAVGNPATYTVESGLITLDDPTREGYDFLGWTPTDNIPAGSVGDVTFTATWSQPHVHTVTYFVNGGTETGLDGVTPYRVYTNVAYGTVVPVPVNPQQDEFTFDGWTTAIPVNMPDADVVIYGSMTRLPALQEIITNERTPLAGPTWSLLNLILTVLTVLSIGTILSIFQKKRENKGTKKNTAFSLSTLLPAAGVIVAFIMTQVLSGTMVFTDRWSYLFAGITLVQAAVVTLALTGKSKKA